MEMMFSLVSGAPRALRMASDQAFWFSPVGVWYSAVACGVSPLDWLVDAAVDGAVVAGARVGVAVLDGVGFADALCVAGAGIFAVAKPSGLALAWRSELPAADGTAIVAASRGFAELAVSGVGTTPKATAT